MKLPMVFIILYAVYTVGRYTLLPTGDIVSERAFLAGATVMFVIMTLGELIQR